MSKPPESLIRLFFSKLLIPGDIEDCWEWKGAKYPSGYGAFGWAYKRGYEQRAHRFSWELYFEPIPKGFVIRHKCNNRSCSNPNHLMIGSTQDNTQDRELFGCPAKGAKIGNSKLTEAQVRAIFKDSRTHPVIAKDYGIYCSMVAKIKQGKSWKHLKLLPEATSRK